MKLTIPRVLLALGVLAAVALSQTSLTWSAQSLPQGLTLSPTGTLSGTPCRAGDYNFTVRVIDASGQTAERILNLKVLPRITINEVKLVPTQIGSTLQLTLNATVVTDTCATPTPPPPGP